MRNKILIIMVTLLIGFGSTQSWGSTLSDVANSMPAGTWAQLNTNGFNDNYLHYPNGPNTNATTQYMGEATWDSVSKRVLFLAAAHYNYSQLHIYSDSTNAWTRGPEPPGAPISFGHGYNHNAINVSGRVLGFIHVKSNSIEFKQYNIGANIWTNRASGTNDGAIAHALVYFPERSKWYVPDGTYGNIREYDHIADSWSTYAQNADCFGDLGYYHEFASYNAVRKEIVFGGGNKSSGADLFSKRWCKMNSNGDITVMPLAPHTLRIPESGNPTQGSLITIDPVSGDLLVLAQTGNFYAFNFSTNQWTSINDQATRPAGLNHSSNNVGNGFVVPISTYGVVMYADYNGDNSSIWLYKHAAGAGTPPPPVDTTPPSTPQGLSLSWSAPTDNSKVTGYQITKGNIPIATSSTVSFQDTGLTSSISYSYTVKAFDEAGNHSPSSSPTQAATQGTSTPPWATPSRSSMEFNPILDILKRGWS